MNQSIPSEADPHTAALQPGAGGRFSCFVMGTESLLIQCVGLLQGRGHTVLGVITADATISAWAQEQGVRLVVPGPGLADRLRADPFDYFFSITNLTIIPDEILVLPAKGAINFHDGPLPHYAGLHATSWALINQESTHGITWHSMASEVDRGEILKQRIIPISQDESAFSLNVKCYEAGIETFGELVDELAKGLVQPIAQPPGDFGYFGKYQRPAAACILDWRQPARNLLAMTRALDFGPYPNPLGLPKLLAGDQAFVVSKMQLRPATTATPWATEPGTITAATKDGLQVATGEGDLLLGELRTLTGQPLTVAEFMDQTGLHAGDQVTRLDDERASLLTRLNGRLARHESFWVGQLRQFEPFELPYASASGTKAQQVESI
ncbi:MAG: non-ribosomal peptide synthetase, partial [Caldilineaceae bacterium]|nr:non-ribosomal peptide synthetase [Caldilineaceae bacterium]